MSETTSIQFDLLLARRGQSFVIEVGKGAASLDEFIRREGVWRSVRFEDCKIGYADHQEIFGRNIYELSFTVTVNEQPPNEPYWPAEPWRIGLIYKFSSFPAPSVDLYVSPVTFQHFWEMADAPEPKKTVSVLTVRGQSLGHNFGVHDIRLLPADPRKTGKAYVILAKVERTVRALAWLSAAILAVELIHLLWR